jgi:hypothetical protein
MPTLEPNSNGGPTFRSEPNPSTESLGPPPWHPDLAAIDVETDGATGQVLMLRHPTTPFMAEWQEADGFRGLARIANAYLTQVAPRVGLPAVWLADLRASIGDGGVDERGLWRPFAGWLPFREDGDGERRGSLWVERFADAGSSTPTQLIDRTAILLGGLFASAKFVNPYFGQQAIRVVVHVDPVQGSRVPIRITGMSTTLPRWDFDLEFDHPIVSRLGRDAWTQPALDILNEVVQLNEAEVSEIGLRLFQLGGKKAGVAFDVLAKTTAKTAEGTAYAIGVRLGRGPQPELLFRTPLASNAVDARVFEQDPMSFHGATHFHDVRPCRPSAKFDDATVWRQFSDLPAAVGGQVPLEDRWVRVTNSRLADQGRPNAAPKEVPDYVDEPARTNMAAAVNAYYHVRSLFDRMVADGFVPESYLEFAELPLLVRYRSGLTPGAGKDGNTVNAQVVQLPIPLARAGSSAISLPSQIEMRFALGDLQCSPRRQPLGIACDPRWCWHELSHVLLAGAVNELEFRFAHSAGDALAAIVLDPDSKLATGHNSAWRGVTFPWIASRRRHDRDVALGWGWNGEMYQRERFFAGPDECCKRGYWAEQILSSSLFRLYRAIGGDSETSPGVVATAVRKAAADYAVYLIMKAIKLIGPASSSPAKTPDQFVSALIDADVGPKVVYNVPPHSTGAHRRSPGTAHKVIRWSFEQQGLYAHSPDGFPLARPGDPPTVDVYIDDGRHGHYSPISFLAGSWHAQPASFWIRHSSDAHAGDQPPRPQRDNFVYLKVQNRGRHRASNVAVDVWVTPLTVPGAYPDFPGTGWQRLGSSIVKNVPAAGTHPGEEVFGPYTWAKPQSGQSYALLAVTTCADDRANSDAATGFLCANPANAGDASPIAYLVACDNNLGLREVRV